MNTCTSIKGTSLEPKIGEMSSGIKCTFILTLGFQDHTARKLKTVKTLSLKSGRGVRNVQHDKHERPMCLTSFQNTKKKIENMIHTCVHVAEYILYFCMILTIVTFMALLSICTALIVNFCV